MIKVNSFIFINESDIELKFIRAPGPGGQNVNKVASAVVLRFNIGNTSLSETVRNRLLIIAKNQITFENDLIIKASRYRTQERNKADAIKRLVELVNRASIIPKKRFKTKPTLASKEKRLTQKKLRAKNKALRRNYE